MFTRTKLFETFVCISQPIIVIDTKIYSKLNLKKNNNNKLFALNCKNSDKSMIFLTSEK